MPKKRKSPVLAGNGAAVCESGQQSKYISNPRQQRVLHALLSHPSIAREQCDKRALHVKYTVEAEAMPAHILRRILREEVEALLPAYALDVAKVAEESERRHLLRMASIMQARRTQ